MKNLVRDKAVSYTFFFGVDSKVFNTNVTKQYILQFALHESYVKEVTWDVVPLDVCRVILEN